MTYGELKSLVRGLLVGDTMLPDDDTVVKALLQDAYDTVANEADALHLMTLNKDANILRTSMGSYLMRVPNLPNDDADKLDIDHELCFAVARYMCVVLSQLKPMMHLKEAEKRIKWYNAKVAAVLEEMSNKDALSDTIDPDIAEVSTVGL